MKRSSSHRSSLFVVVLAIAAMLAVMVPAQAANGFVVAPPGATIGAFLPKPVVLQQGNQLKFINLDAAPHDVRSVQPGLFTSPVIGIGKQAFVNKANLLPKGTYPFYCSIHPNMKGKLRVL